MGAAHGADFHEIEAGADEVRLVVAPAAAVKEIVAEALLALDELLLPLRVAPVDQPVAGFPHVAVDVQCGGGSGATGDRFDLVVAGTQQPAVEVQVLRAPRVAAGNGNGDRRQGKGEA